MTDPVKGIRVDEDDPWDEMLRAGFARLAEQPVDRGPEAGELWARAAVVRRLEAQSILDPQETSSSLVWGPLVGALTALLLVAAIWFLSGAGLPQVTSGGSGDVLFLVLAIVVGSVGVVGLAACSSLALLWNDL
ncbi:MAG: hypothetical protein MPN21_06435 [Thermoanaerobaculia bacterium]|nr:hypothetical protein [Thermoanaerobaculia bacterium]